MTVNRRAEIAKAVAAGCASQFHAAAAALGFQRGTLSVVKGYRRANSAVHDHAQYGILPGWVLEESVPPVENVQARGNWLRGHPF